MGDDPYTQSSDHRLLDFLSSRNPVIRRPDGVINGTRRGYRRYPAGLYVTRRINNQMAERASHSASHATPSKGYKGSCTTGSTSIHKPSIPETESYERQECGFHL